MVYQAYLKKQKMKNGIFISIHWFLLKILAPYVSLINLFPCSHKRFFTQGRDWSNFFFTHHFSLSKEIKKSGFCWPWTHQETFDCLILSRRKATTKWGLRNTFWGIKVHLHLFHLQRHLFRSVSIAAFRISFAISPHFVWILSKNF